MFRQGRAIPIPINDNRDEAATQRINVKRVAASKPQALGMVDNAKLCLNTYKADVAISFVAFLDCFAALAMTIRKELL